MGQSTMTETPGLGLGSLVVWQMSLEMYIALLLASDLEIYAIIYLNLC